MLTRLKVTGFKNLVDVDVRFGPFTCIAGANGAGKSNLFDAIRFLSDLANKTLMEAAIAVRSEAQHTGDIRAIFTRIGDEHFKEMHFEVEMLIPRYGVDELEQEAEASATLLRYVLTLGYRNGTSTNGSSGSRSPSLEILREELRHINKSDAHDHLLFPHRASTWRDSVIHNTRRNAVFISTEGEGATRTLKIHQDGGARGRPLTRPGNLPRTIVSATNTVAESPTIVMARKEMQAWRMLQLEPSELGTPDAWTAPTKLATNGANLAATLYHLAESNSNPERVYATVANRLSELLEDVRELSIDRDERRNLLTLRLMDFQRTTHAARALSDGTLRFLALAILEQDFQDEGVICLEEPENGIHPARIPAMINLLKSIAVDTDEFVDQSNPLRQVIINTHSPRLVQEVPQDSLIFAKLTEIVRDDQRLKVVDFRCLPEVKSQQGSYRNWRLNVPAEEQPNTIVLGDLLNYLTTSSYRPSDDDTDTSKRLEDRPDVQHMLSAFKETA
jgi:predicted ATPase